jgi:hypothetical protein
MYQEKNSKGASQAAKSSAQAVQAHTQARSERPRVVHELAQAARVKVVAMFGVYTPRACLAMAGDDQISLGGIHCLTSHSEAFTLKSTSEALSLSCCKIHKADPPFSRFLVFYVQTKSEFVSASPSGPSNPNTLNNAAAISGYSHASLRRF